MSGIAGSVPPFQLDRTRSIQLSTFGSKFLAKKGTILFGHGDSPTGAYLLIRGEVKLSAGESMANFRRNCLPGCLLGLPATLRNLPYSLTAECLEDCECIRVSHDGLISLMGTNKEFCLHVVEVLANEVGELRSRVPTLSSARWPCH